MKFSTLYRIGILALILYAFIGATSGSALAQEVDWKFYGGAPTDDGANECFFDVNGVAHGADKYIRVWTKCLIQKDMDDIDIAKEYGGTILDNTAKKISNYYIPPIAKINPIDGDQAMQITMYEEIADISHLQPRTKIFYEINCPDKTLRELSIYVKIGNKIGFVDTPGKWKYIAPESNGSKLAKLLCQ